MPAFAEFRNEVWPYRFSGRLHVPVIVGGTPMNQKVAEGWLRSKLADKDDLIRDMVATIMVERSVSADEAAKIVDDQQHLNGFRRDEQGLYIEGRQLKAAVKEAVSIANAAGKLTPPNGAKGWGKTGKSVLGFVAEHVMIVDDRLPLRREDGSVHQEPSGIMQRFVHTFRGNAIQYEEYVEDAVIDFTVISDYDFSEKAWAHIWVTGEQQGIGASRSQGFGRYTVESWEPMSAVTTKKPRRKVAAVAAAA